MPIKYFFICWEITILKFSVPTPKSWNINLWNLIYQILFSFQYHAIDYSMTQHLNITKFCTDVWRGQSSMPTWWAERRAIAKRRQRNRNRKRWWQRWKLPVPWIEKLQKFKAFNRVLICFWLIWLKNNISTQNILKKAKIENSDQQFSSRSFYHCKQKWFQRATFNSIFAKYIMKSYGMGSGGGLEGSVVSFYSNNLSLISVEVLYKDEK